MKQHPVPYTSRRLALANRWDGRHLRTVLDHLKPAPGSSILEVGCARGHLVKNLRACGFDAHGIDLNPEAIALSVAGHTRVMDATVLDFPEATFDAVISIHAVEHIPELGRALSEMTRVLKPGGTLLLVYPAEPIRGLYALPASLLAFGTVRMARRIHCHRLTPRRLLRFTDPGKIEHLHSRFTLLSSPQFVSVLRRL